MHVLAFDCFGTVFDASGIPADDVRSYVAQTRRPEWAPLKLPESFYGMMPHADAREGIAKLREKFKVVTCSNLPLEFLFQLSTAAGIYWDAIIPLEASRSYKPSSTAYNTVTRVMQVPPNQISVVTAHANGPDIEGAPKAGMGVQLIRNPFTPQTIIELANMLEGVA